MISWKFSLVSALATSSVESNFPTLKETDPNDTKGSLDSHISNCALSFPDLVFDVKLSMGGRNEDGEKDKHIITLGLSECRHFQIAMDNLCCTAIMGISYISRG